jgi:purine-nucleoside phosphorylase
VAARLQKACPLRPSLAIVLGSGFQHAAELLRADLALPYAEIPGFPNPSAGGHAGQLLIGKAGPTPVLILSGRAHYYEGHSMDQVTFPVRVLAECGVRALLLTNAAGGINPRFRPGDFMLITDHINAMGANPLRGPDAAGQPRFVDLTHTYDPQLRRLLQAAARKVALRLRSGVYLAVAGPSYETPAEIRAYARLGADAVGMSTVPEAIVARQCGLSVAGLSCITNLAAGRTARPLSHAEVLRMGKRVKSAAGALLQSFVALYGQAE